GGRLPLPARAPADSTIRAGAPITNVSIAVSVAKSADPIPSGELTSAGPSAVAPSVHAIWIWTNPTIVAPARNGATARAASARSVGKRAGSVRAASKRAVTNGVN